jgi:peptide chain release factor subunit 1
MLTLNDIQMLASRPERSEDSVLTLYLDVDQSNQANLNRGFERQFKDLLAGVKNSLDGANESTIFKTASNRVEEFIGQYNVGARSLAAVCDASDGFFWMRELDLPVSSRIDWGREALIEPLIAAVDEYEEIGIALVDRANLRLFTMFLGKVHELAHESFDRRKVRHTKTAGWDNLVSAGHAEHKADEQARFNMRRMSSRITSAVEQRGIRRFILAGSPEVTGQVQSLLPKRLASLVIGTAEVAKNATPDEIRKVAAPIAEKFERESEQSVVTQLVTSAAKSRRAVVGLANTLYAVNQSRIWQLVYADEFQAPGYECTECAALFPLEAESCSLCGSSVDPVDNVVELAVAHAARKGASLEIIRGQETGSSLMNAGGIGAFLRTRTASVVGL